MRNIAELLTFLKNQMSMTDIYQPAVILHLLERDGIASKHDLSRTLSGYDNEIQEYYERILMRWPKITLTKHKVVRYEKHNAQFILNFDIADADAVEIAKRICEEKIRDWIEKKASHRSTPKIGASVRYRVLKAARGKCELCGISAKVAPIDIDHIVPRNQADSNKYVLQGKIKMHVDDERNLQALCYRCNRAKRDQDSTDFRQPRSRLIREHQSNYDPHGDYHYTVRHLSGHELKEKLFEKLVQEHARLIDQNSDEQLVDRIADMMEALIAIAVTESLTEEELFRLMQQRRNQFGSLTSGLYLDDQAS